MTGNSTPTPMPLGEGRFLIGATVGRGESSDGRAAESNGVVAITRSSYGQWQADYVWRSKRATSSFGSPVSHAGTAYFVNQTGVLYGLDLQTGEEVLAKRLSGSTWATPLGVGNHLFVFGKDGRVDIVAIDDAAHDVETWESLPPDPNSPSATPNSPFGGSVLYSATWSDGLVLLRRGDRLFAVPIVPAT